MNVTEIQNYVLSSSLEPYETEADKKIENDIILIPKSYSVFVQTDKPVYNLGSEVLCRVLVLNSELKPYNPKDLKIEIYDSKGNLLIWPESSKAKTSEDNNGDDDDDDEPEGNIFDSGEKPAEKLEQTPTSSAHQNGKNPLIHKSNGKIFDGLYSYHYKIHDEAHYGNWSLKVIINNQIHFTTTHYFEVREFILPRFEVVVQTKREVGMTDNVIILSVHGNYTFGELVEGNVEVKASVYDPQFQHRIQKNVTKNAIANFVAQFTFDIKEELNIRNHIRPYEVRFDVEFKEKLTNQTMAKEAIVRVFRNMQYFVNIIHEKATFKPGFEYKFSVSVENFDREPITSQTVDVIVEVKYFLMAKRCTLVHRDDLLSEKTIQHRKRPFKGIAEFVLDVPDEATGIVLTATFKESKTNIKVLAHQGSSEFIHLEAKKKTW